MKLLSHNGGLFATNAYLLADEATGQAVIFDAPNDTTAPLLEAAKQKGWDVIGLWLTHGHIDHIADHAVVTSSFPQAKVLIHRLDEPKLMSPMSSFSLPFRTPGRKADEWITDGQQLQIGSLAVEAIHTPGHSPGHVMFHLPAENLLIGGDLIIMGAVGRTDFPDCSYADLQTSIRRIMKLPAQTTLLAGHGNPSTLAEELRSNPYVREALAAQKK